MRTPIEAQRRYGGPWKPAELSDEAEPADSAPVVFMAGIDEPLGVADGDTEGWRCGLRNRPAR